MSMNRDPLSQPEDQKTEIKVEENSSPSASGLFSLQKLCMDKALSLAHLAKAPKPCPDSKTDNILKDKYLELKQIKLTSLLTAILSGDREKVEKLITKYPILLLEELEEKECHMIQGILGHKASPTAYRTALATDDKEIASPIRNKLIEIAGVAEADKQRNEQLPPGKWEIDEEVRWSKVFTQISKLANAIQHGNQDITTTGAPVYLMTIPDDSRLGKALAEFRSSLDAILNEVVKTGRHFNPKIFKYVITILTDLHANFFNENESDHRRHLYWQQVIGYIERVMPVHYLQAFGAGLRKTCEKRLHGEFQDRSLKFEIYLPDTRQWTEIDLKRLHPCLGFDLAIYGEGPPPLRICRSNPGKQALERLSINFSEFISNREPTQPQQNRGSKP